MREYRAWTYGMYRANYILFFIFLFIFDGIAEDPVTFKVETVKELMERKGEKTQSIISMETSTRIKLVYYQIIVGHLHQENLHED